MRRLLTAVSTVALLAGLASVAQAQSAYPETNSSSSTTVTTSVAQAPVAVRPVTTSDYAVRPGPYLRFDTGGSWATSRNIDSSWIVGGGAGWRFTPNLRGDITFDYRGDYNQTTNLGIGPNAKSGLHNWTLMANGYYDFTVPGILPLVPYVGGGIGIAHNSVNGVSVNVPGTGVASLTGHDSDQFAWQVSAGIAYNFTPTLALDVGYRYLDAGSAGFAGHLHANELTTALRFGF